MVAVLKRVHAAWRKLRRKVVRCSKRMRERPAFLLLLTCTLTVLIPLYFHIARDNHEELLMAEVHVANAVRRAPAVRTASYPVFPHKPFVIWSNDYHIGPIRDLKHLLAPLGVRFIDKSLSGHCHLTGTCHHNLTVIDKANAMGLDDTGDLVGRFYDAYKADPEMRAVDAFVCFHPSAMCELFAPFNKSVFVIASTRYELGRHSAARWRQWNRNLARMAERPGSVVAGNNLYDAKYIEYFTGIPATVLPSYCGYIADRYTGTRAGFILAPIHKPGFDKILIKAFTAACNASKCGQELFSLRDRYQHYEYSDLAAHQGIVYVPYQVSVMSLFEQYRMNIPLFFPSRRLLAGWQHRFLVMSERTWDAVFGRIPSGSAIPPHPSQRGVPDPNSETNRTAIEHWIRYADFYQWPHVTYYESHGDLVAKMRNADLKVISDKMAAYNVRFKEKLLAQWAGILKTAARYSPNNHGDK